MPLLTATKVRRTEANTTKRYRELERILDEMGDSIATEVERLRDSYDNIAATSAFSLDSVENGDTSPCIVNQARILGASLVWHAERLSSLRQQGRLVEMAKGSLAILMAQDSRPIPDKAAAHRNGAQDNRDSSTWTA